MTDSTPIGGNIEEAARAQSAWRSFRTESGFALWGLTVLRACTRPVMPSSVCT